MQQGERPVRRHRPDRSQWIRKVEIKDISSGRELSLPMMCQHCEHPPCVDVCPTTASFRRATASCWSTAIAASLPLLHDGLPVQGALLRA